MARGQSIASAHVDFSAEGLPELLKGVKTAAQALNAFKVPELVSDSQVKGFKEWIAAMKGGRKEIARLNQAIKDGQTEFKVTPLMAAGMRDKQAIEGIRAYQSQVEKLNAINKRRDKDEKDIEKTLARQLQLKHGPKNVAKADNARSAQEFLKAGGTLPMRESLVSHKEGFEEKRGRFGASNDIRRNPVAYLDQTLTAGRASGDITGGSEYETFLKAMREQTVVSEGDSEAVTRVARIAEQQMSALTGNTGAIRLAQQFQGQSDERQGRQSDRDKLGVSGRDFSRIQGAQVAAQVGSNAGDARPEMAQAARDTANHIAKQTRAAANEFYDQTEAQLRYELSSGAIGDAEFSTGVARVEAGRSRDQERTRGLIGRELSEDNIGGMINEGSNRISTGGFTPNEQIAQFGILAKQVYSDLEQKLEQALTQPFDAQRERIIDTAAMASGTSKKLTAAQSEQLKQDLEGVDRDEGRARERDSLVKGLQSEADDIQGSGSSRVANLEREIKALEEIKRLRGGDAEVVKKVDEDIALKESQVPILKNLDHAESEAKGLGFSGLALGTL